MLILCCKQTDRINSSGHSRTMTKSIPYSKALWVKEICNETSDLSKNL